MNAGTAKALRVDLIIALCALVVSCLAAGAAVYQGHVIASQLSVTVWPYVTFRESSSNTYVEIDVQNVGSGPAIIGSAALYVDGKPQSSLTGSLPARVHAEERLDCDADEPRGRLGHPIGRFGDAPARRVEAIRRSRS